MTVMMTTMAGSWKHDHALLMYVLFAWRQRPHKRKQICGTILIKRQIKGLEKFSISVNNIREGNYRVRNVDRYIPSFSLKVRLWYNRIGKWCGSDLYIDCNINKKSLPIIKRISTLIPNSYYSMKNHNGINYIYEYMKHNGHVFRHAYDSSHLTSLID